jgi:hypothetical protein
MIPFFASPRGREEKDKILWLRERRRGVMQNQGQFVSSFRVWGKFLPRENPVCATFPRGRRWWGDLRTLIIPYYPLYFVFRHFLNII